MAFECVVVLHSSVMVFLAAEFASRQTLYFPGSLHLPTFFLGRFLHASQAAPQPVPALLCHHRHLGGRGGARLPHRLPDQRVWRSTWTFPWGFLPWNSHIIVSSV